MDGVECARGPSLKRNRTQKVAADSREHVELVRRSDKRCRQADAFLNFVTKKEISKRRAQWRDTGMQLLRNTPSTLWGGAIDVVSPAQAADARNRILGQELPPGQDRLYEKDASAAKTRELDDWSQFKVYSPMEPGKCNKDVVGTRWI